ncbi:3'-5' exonuclease [Marinomonas ostreistagni]|uniref:3'-5' exonuclease n=1 Tax=Marinomonas ostreistagni TaxID=359209 RepID=UPI00194E9514|nr:3'-5' exonuclease [Marinomonas ostreistagni]
MGRVKDEFSWRAFLTQQASACEQPVVQQFIESQIFPEHLTVAEAEFVALDFETTGLDVENDEIVSIGLVPFTLDRIKVSQARHWIVKPECNLKDDSIVIHGITHSAISDAPTLDEVLEQVLSCLAGRVVVVHYQYIEREFLNRAVQHRFDTGLVFPMVDTMWLEGVLYRAGWRNKLKRLLGGRLQSIRLADSRLRYALPRYHLHSAMSDAIATAELLQAQIKHRYSNNKIVTELFL